MRKSSAVPKKINKIIIGKRDNLGKISTNNNTGKNTVSIIKSSSSNRTKKMSDHKLPRKNK